MRLDEIKELVEKGLTNTAIAEAVKMSVRQVQRIKRRLLETPVKLPRTEAQLVKLLQKKAAQGDLHSIKLLLKEYRETPAPEAQAEELVHVAFHFLAIWLTPEEREIHTGLLRKVVNRHERWKGQYLPVEEQIEAMARKEEQPSPSAPPLSVEIPTPPSLPSRGSTDVDDPKPSTSAAGNTPEGRELPPSPLVNHTEEVNQKRGGLRILKEK